MIHNEGCACCGKNEGPMYLHAKCHPDAYTWTKLESNELTVECATCKRRVATFRVMLNERGEIIVR